MLLTSIMLLTRMMLTNIMLAPESCHQHTSTQEHSSPNAARMLIYDLSQHSHFALLLPHPYLTAALIWSTTSNYKSPFMQQPKQHPAMSHIGH
jgi:hypothetical protein